MKIGSDINGEGLNDQSGTSVSLSSDGKRVAIAAIYKDGTFEDAGHVRVFSETSGAWSQLGSAIHGEAAGDKSGYSVSLSSDGKTVAIGAPWNDGSFTDAGHVRVYSESGGVWTQKGSDIDGVGKSGSSVSLSFDGKRIAIGATGYDLGEWPDLVYDVGNVRIYSESGGVWTQVGTDIIGIEEFDYVGYSVSLSSDGKRIAIGAPDNFHLDSPGRVQIYSESGGVWTQVGSDIIGEANSDQSGHSVALSSDGKRIAIGAPGNDGSAANSGSVRIYSESGGVWTQIGSDIDGEAAVDYSGRSIALSSDGRRVAIGAYFNDGGGSQAGHVRIYSEAGSVWTQVGSDIDGEVVGDLSGASVDLSSDGKRVASGAPGNDNAGNNSGTVRVYNEIPNSCTNGSIIYNTLTGKFNFCENGIWVEK